ncbi:MAG TPA: hypothetical protein PK668_22770 [Myxococcota bacterium]|nr:hypothetical protein [Myxococcota bacterium]HRY95518.1 hypothetical protein [Myxococcota bacterium]
MQRFITDERMYQAGLLRIAMRMRTDPKKLSFEEQFQHVQAELRLEPEGFRRYVNANMTTLVTASKKAGR